MKRVAILAFCLTSCWTAASWAQDAGCTITAMNNEYDNSCATCRSDADAGIADCQANRKLAGKVLACTRDDNGVTVEIWCSPVFGSTAKPSGCSIQTPGGPSPFGTLATLGVLGLSIVFGRRWRRR